MCRKPLGDRWCPSTVDLVRHPPWRTSDDDLKADGEKPDVIKMKLPVRTREEVQEELVVPRRLYLKKQDI